MYNFPCVLKIYITYVKHYNFSFITLFSLLFLRDRHFCTKIFFNINTFINFPQESQNTGVWQACFFRNQTILSVGMKEGGGRYQLGSNDDARRNPCRWRRRARELREDATKKGAQSRAANEHPRTSSRPVVSVSAGRRRPKVAVADGRERTRGRQDQDRR